MLGSSDGWGVPTGTVWRSETGTMLRPGTRLLALGTRAPSAGTGTLGAAPRLGELGPRRAGEPLQDGCSC